MVSRKVTTFAPAKVNLALHVIGQRADGYHLLDSLVMFADFGDHVTVTPSVVAGMSVIGPMAAGVPTDQSNLCFRAAVAFGESVYIILDKHLPAGAGVGGGSSDAAAVLRAMSQLYGRPIAADPVALGADVPVCLAASAARMQGIGEVVTSFQMPNLQAVLVNPNLPIGTPHVFKALSKRNNPPMILPDRPLTETDAAIEWIKDQRNDMQEAAIQVQPVINEVLSVLDACGSLCTRMSGSGATCFGLYRDLDRADAAANAIRTERPNWWVQAVTLS